MGNTSNNAVQPVVEPINDEKVTAIEPSPVKLNSPKIHWYTTPRTSLVKTEEKTSSEPADFVTKTPTESLARTVTIVSNTVSKWYRWKEMELERKRQKTEKSLWYKDSTVESIDSSKTSIVNSETKVEEKISTIKPDEIRAPASFQLRSTAVYSPPHGDRFLPGRKLNDQSEDKIDFKYYFPDQQRNQSVFDHSKTTMSRMNTRLRTIPLLTSATNSSTTIVTQSANDRISLPTFVSRGLQTGLETVTVDGPNGQETQYFEKGTTQEIPISTLSNVKENENEFYHLDKKPILAPTEKVPAASNETVLPKSILKNSSQSESNLLSTETHNKVVEQVRQQRPDFDDATFRVKKIHLLEKQNHTKAPPTVSFKLTSQPSKASQSISRSKRLFS